MNRATQSLLVLLMHCVVLQDASAEIATFRFSGLVTDVTLENEPVPGVFVGDPVSGTFSYNTATQPIHVEIDTFSGSTYATYSIAMPDALAATLGGQTYSWSTSDIGILDQQGTSPDSFDTVDSIVISSPTFPPPIVASIVNEGLGPPNYLNLRFLDLSGTTLANTSLPTQAPSFQQFLDGANRFAEGVLSFEQAGNYGVLFEIRSIDRVLPESVLATSPPNGSPIDFGAVRVGTEVTRSVEVSNVGGVGSSLVGTLTHPDLTLDERFTGQSRRVAIHDLLPSDSPQIIPITFNPSQRGELDAAAVVETNGGNATIGLKGNAVGPEMSLHNAGTSGGRLEFPISTVGSRVIRPIRLQNFTEDEGSLDLTGLSIQGYELVGSDSDDFRLLTPDGQEVPRSQPFQLAKGAFRDMGLEFAPKSAGGTKTAEIVFFTDQGAAFGADAGRDGEIRYAIEGPAVDRGIKIAFDYSMDDSNFFAAGSSQRNTLEAVGRFYETLLENDSLDEIPSEAGQQWLLRLRNPSTGADTILNGNDLPGIPANTVRIFVGAMDQGTFPNGDPLFASAGPASLSVAPGYENLIQRGKASDEFAPWIGSLTVDDDKSVPNWHFPLDSVSSAQDNKVDFLTILLHEVGHILGIGTSVQWESLATAEGFQGSRSTEYFGEPVPLSGDVGRDHFQDKVTSDVFDLSVSFSDFMGTVAGGRQQASFDQLKLQYYKREGLTDLDIAALVDIGWDIALPFKNDRHALFVANSPISLGQFVDTSDDAFEMSFDYRFVDMVGSLEVWLNGHQIATILPGTAAEASEARILVDDPFLGLDDSLLEFIYNGPKGSQFYLDNVLFPGITNGDFQIGDLTNWFAAGGSEGRVTSRFAVPEPSGAIYLVIASILFVVTAMRRRVFLRSGC